MLQPYGATGSGNYPGEVFGSIGADGSQAFYSIPWGGGEFDVNAEVYGADPEGEYDFELLSSSGDLIDSVILDAANDFFAYLDYNLAAGQDYEIGLVADSPSDPNFSVTFGTPLGKAGSASVPEPASLGLLCLGLMSLAVTRRKFKELTLER